MDNEIIVSVYLALVMAVCVDVLRRVIAEFILVQRNGKIAKRMRKLRRPVQPWVTVLIYDNYAVEATEKTRRSLQKSRYHHFDIVEVGPRARTYQTAYRKSKRGAVVVCIRAGIVVDPGFIKRAVAVGEERRVWREAVQEKPERAVSLTAIVTSLKRAVVHRPVHIDVCVAAEIRKKRIVSGYSRWQRWASWSVLVGVYGLVVAGVVYAGFSVLWWLWLLATFYLLALIWVQSYQSTEGRWRLSFSVPSALFLIPVASIFLGISQLRSR